RSMGAVPGNRVRNLRRSGRSFLWTLVAVVLVAAFLSPMLRPISFPSKRNDQIHQPGSPIFPADPQTFTFEGRTYDVYQVPIDGGSRDLALFKKGRTESQFLDPANPGAGPIVWQGSWRALQPAWTLAPHFENFADVWSLINYPRLLFNTVVIALITVF